MAEEDEEKTAFHTSKGVFYYTKIPFGLKNASATYQQLVDKAFERQIGRNLKVYVDELVIKSHTKQEILKDIKETFHNLRRINMKLNPKKCTFGTEEGAFLGHMVSMKGIKACQEKAEAVMKLQSPRTLKEAQSLNGKLSSLNRFLSKFAERSFPFFKTLKRCMKKSDFQWTPEAKKGVPKHEVIQRSGQCSPTSEKRLTANASLLRQPRLTALGNKLQFNGKTGLSTITCHKKVEAILPSTSGSILAGFIAERPNDEGPSTEAQAEDVIPEPWILFTDGSSCLEGSGAGLIRTSLEGEEFTYTLRFKFNASNNEAEGKAKSYLTTESSSGITHSKTGANNSTLSKEINQAENDEGLLLNLDILEERREKAVVREARSKAKMEKYYNAKVHSTTFCPGVFVIHSNKASHAKESGKLGPKWEGPYEVVEALRKRAYKLRNGSGDILPRTWNIKDLKNVIFKFPSCKHPCQCKTALAVGVIFN
ncbi:reverse transcriptase domain-containing protein [Tanacetum coccineum]